MTARSLDEAFELLKLASELEALVENDNVLSSNDGSKENNLKGNEEVLAIVNKYWGACQLLFDHAEQLSSMPFSKRSSKDVASEKLLRAKVEEYWRHAVKLLNARANSILDFAIKVDEASENMVPNKQEDAVKNYIYVAEFYISMKKILDKEKMNGWMKICCNDSASEFITPDILNKRLESILSRVEALKNIKSLPLASQEEKKMVTPSLLSQHEVSVLKKSSLMSSGLFLPWNEKEAREFSYSVLLNSNGSGKCWRDPDGLLKLSSSQFESGFQTWMRPNDIASRNYLGKPVMACHVSPYLIKQTCVTDCSFIASLCICAAFENRFKRRIVTSLIHPKDNNGNPIINPEGRYMVKFWLNGIERRVIVDDLLPVDRRSRLLCSHVSSSSLDLWVPIIEKAYMKLCGGYDFPGSNSNVDMFSLTGWIPERIFFASDEKDVKDFETPAERAWERLKSATSFGDCMITVSTSLTLTEQEADRVGLITAHAYALLNVFESRNGIRLLQLKNPWMKNGWKGRYSSSDSVNWTTELQRECGYNLIEASKQNDGIFWICWNDILRYFQNIFLSWNPALFSHKAIMHSSWPKEKGPLDDSFNAGENPQYILKFDEQALRNKASVWILISRHVTKQEQEGQEPSDFLTLHVYEGEKSRMIWYLNDKYKCLSRGAYTNSPHVLTRLDLSKKHKYLSLVLSQHKKSNDVNYTLSVYSTKGAFQIQDSSSNIPKNKKSIKSAWKSNCDGGPPRKGFYAANPMWSIDVESDTSLQIQCSTSKDIPINLRLEEKEFVSRISYEPASNPMIDTGTYRNGFVATDIVKVKKGSYTLIPSAFYSGEKGQGPLSIEVRTSIPVAIREIPQYATLINRHITGKWSFDHGTACGSPNHTSYERNPTYTMRVKGQQNEYVYIRLSSLKKSETRLGLNVTLYEENKERNRKFNFPPYTSPQGKTYGAVMSSEDGVYLSGTRGVEVKALLDNCKSYVIIPSTYDPIELEFQLDLRCTGKLSLKQVR